MKERSSNLLSGFILKIIAIVAMTCDHVGVFTYGMPGLEILTTILRSIGRIALPMFIFLIAEGVRYTKNEKKYLLRLGILALAFLAGQLFIYFVDNSNAMTSPIVDLFTVAITLMLLKRKNKWSFFAVIPISIVILNFVVFCLENNSNFNGSFFPFFLRQDYPLFSLLLGIAFYYSKAIGISILKLNQNTEALTTTSYVQVAQNILSAIFVVVLSITFFVSLVIFNISYSVIDVQFYAAFAALPILFYSGKRGYNKKWFQYGCYIYVPLHLVIIFLIFILL